jgi:hypothetical protein
MRGNGEKSSVHTVGAECGPRQRRQRHPRPVGNAEDRRPRRSLRQSACTAERFTSPYTKHEEESSRTGTRTGTGQVFIQIGIGIGIGIDHLITNTRDGTAQFLSTDLHRLRRFFGGIARVFGGRQGEFPIFVKFHVFHGSIQIGIGIGIAIGIDCRAHEAARNDECKGGGGPEPDSDGTVMEPRNV